MASIFERIKKIVRLIPKGKVTTYGAIAQAVGTKDNRLVGWAVYGNSDPSVPCQRVVFKNGQLAEKYSLGGWQEQRKRLLKEKVRFKSPKKVDLKKSFWDPLVDDKSVKPVAK